jgi:uncharacterized radical SAM superfamily Fe-S cluster-containing enzyme
MGLPKQTRSICPECKKILDARVFEKDGAVRMEKECPVHGRFEDVIYSDAAHYHIMEQYRFGDGRGVEKPHVGTYTACPESCGLCPAHLSHTALGNIDLTNRCNLSCPYCFANSNARGLLYEPSLDQVLGMLRNLRAERPVPAACVQFAGGEPTLHPDFTSIVRAARDLEFSAVQVATNGLRFLDEAFCAECRDAGLNSVYLQFDAMDDETYRKIRGRELLETKLRVVENIRRTGGMSIVLVPTVIQGVNDHAVGEIFRFAVDNVNVITGISFQPVAVTGRVPLKKRTEIRYTLSDMANDLAEQTGALRADGWAPLSATVPLSRLVSALSGREITAYTAHHHCSMATYVFVESSGRPVQITDFIDVPRMLEEMDRLAANLEGAWVKSIGKTLTKFKALNALRRCFRPDRAPEGLTFDVFLRAVEELMGKKSDRSPGRKYAYRTLMVGGMHFMDSYNYDVERVQRCVVHYAAPNGRIYPFCAYNAGPAYRLRIEEKYACTLPELRAKSERLGRPKDLEKLVRDAALGKSPGGNGAGDCTPPRCC